MSIRFPGGTTAGGGGGSGGATVGCYAPPSGLVVETIPRQIARDSVNVLVSGWLALAAVYLPSGLSISKIAYYSTTTVGTPTHCWFGLYDQNRVQLAVTADQGSTAWALGTLRTLNIATTAAGSASSFTTTYSGLHYIGLSVSATSLPSLLCEALQDVRISKLTPILSGLTEIAATPPAFPHTATSMTGNELSVTPWAAVG